MIGYAWQECLKLKTLDMILTPFYFPDRYDITIYFCFRIFFTLLYSKTKVKYICNKISCYNSYSL